MNEIVCYVIYFEHFHVNSFWIVKTHLHIDLIHKDFDNKLQFHVSHNNNLMGHTFCDVHVFFRNHVVVEISKRITYSYIWT